MTQPVIPQCFKSPRATSLEKARYVLQAQIEACKESMRAAQRKGEEDLKEHSQEVQAVRTEHEKDKANIADEVSARRQTLISKAISFSVLMRGSSVSMHMRCGCTSHAWRCLYTMWHWAQTRPGCDACKDQQ